MSGILDSCRNKAEHIVSRNYSGSLTFHVRGIMRPSDGRHASSTGVDEGWAKRLRGFYGNESKAKRSGTQQKSTAKAVSYGKENHDEHEIKGSADARSKASRNHGAAHKKSAKPELKDSSNAALEEDSWQTLAFESLFALSSLLCRELKPEETPEELKTFQHDLLKVKAMPREERASFTFKTPESGQKVKKFSPFKAFEAVASRERESRTVGSSAEVGEPSKKQGNSREERKDSSIPFIPPLDEHALSAKALEIKTLALQYMDSSPKPSTGDLLSTMKLPYNLRKHFDIIPISAKRTLILFFGDNAVIVIYQYIDISLPRNKKQKDSVYRPGQFQSVRGNLKPPGVQHTSFFVVQRPKGADESDVDPCTSYEIRQTSMAVSQWTMPGKGDLYAWYSTAGKSKEWRVCYFVWRRGNARFVLCCSPISQRKYAY